MLEAIKSRIPTPLKRTIRRWLFDPLQRRAGDWRLRQSVRAFRSGRPLDRDFIEQFRRAWGNESFSADVDYISEIVARVGNCSGPVLECGSGLTTLVAALVGKQCDVTVWSLEQDVHWAEFVRRQLKRNRIYNVELRNAPLVEYDGYIWYDIEGIKLPGYFDLVLCDGPAFFDGWGPAREQSRYGLLPTLERRGTSVGEILFDDATESRAANIFRRWRQEFGMGHRLIQTKDGDLAVVSKTIS
jgi:hypothetical protein